MTLKSNKKLIGSIFSYTTAMLIAQVLIAVYTLLLIWWLSTEQYGHIAANYAAVLLTSFIINLGLHEWLIRTIPLEKNSKALTGSILGYKFVVGILWAVGLMIVLPAIQPNIYTPNLLILIILDVWFESSFYLLLADLLGHGEVFPTSALLVSSRILRLTSLILIILFSARSIIFIVLFRLISTIIIFFIAALISKPVLTDIKNFSIKKILGASIVFNAAEIQNLIFLQIDLNLLTLLNGNPTLVGNFAIVLSIINMIMTFPLGIASMILPSSIRSFQNSPVKFKKKMILTLLIFLSFGLLIWAGLSIFRLNIIQTFLDENYQFVVSILLLASPLLFIRTVNQFNKVFLISVREEKRQLLPQTLAIVFKLILGIVIVRQYALVGLVWLSIISDLLLLIGFSVQVVRYYLKNKLKPIQ